jgi:hypothetical protein
MKMHINPFKLLTILSIVLFPHLLKAGSDNSIEKKRTISKSYIVSSSDKLSIVNSFGTVTVSTWEKNEIRVDVEIGVHAATEEKAQAMMDEIKVNDSQGNQNISFKTDIGNMGKGKGNSDERRFYVDYKITMPEKNPLVIENSFGKTVVPNFMGTTNITSKFGELNAGNLVNNAVIHVEFGKANVGNLNNADVVFKYNSQSTIGGLAGNSKVHIEFCSQVNLTITDKLTDLGLFESYSTIRLKVPDNLSAKFDIHTNFGSFDNHTDYQIEETKDDESSGPKFDKDYSGTIGTGNTKIKIKSSFGNIKVVRVNDKSSDKEDSDEDKGKDKDKINL